MNNDNYVQAPIWLWLMLIMCNTNCCYIKDFVLLWLMFTTTNNQNVYYNKQPKPHQCTYFTLIQPKKIKKFSTIWNEHTIVQKFRCEFFTWGDTNFSWGQKQLWTCGANWKSVQTESKPLFWKGGYVKMLYNSNSIFIYSSYVKRITRTPDNKMVSNKSITRYSDTRLHNSISI